MSSGFRIRRSPKGSVLLASMIVIVLLSVVSAGVLSYSLVNYRNSVRQQLLDQAKEIADSEMEYLFFSWKSQLLAKVAPSAIEATLRNAGVCTTATLDGNGNVTDLGTLGSPFLASVQSAGGWRVARDVIFNPVSGTANGSAQGQVTGTQLTGQIFYFSAYVKTVYSGNPVVGTIQFHSGRRFQLLNTSLFQYALFYQGNLEIAAGSSMTISGSIATNGTAYMASTSSAYALTIASKLYYFQDYNPPAVDSGGHQLTDGSGNPIPQLALQGDYSAYKAPIFNPNPSTSVSQATSDINAQNQLVHMDSQNSFLGGVDVANDLTNYPNAYKNQNGVVDPNEVYRSVIAPPPMGVDPGTGQYGFIAEDPQVAARRLYNTSGLIITINQDPSTGTKSVHFGIAPDPANPSTITTNPQIYDTVLAAYKDTIVPPATIRSVINDKRETYTGSTGVATTTIDIGALNTALKVLNPSGSINVSNSGLQGGYNGMVYIHDNTDNTSLLPGGQNAIVLKNAQETPAFNDASGTPLGFSVTSNNGLYVQGNYNTKPLSSGDNNPAALMADAVTVVSEAWTPTQAYTSLPFSQREAAASHDSNLPSSAPPGLVVNSAILTGNTATVPPDPSQGSAGNNSGGAQNLVRLVEDWWYPSATDSNGHSVGLSLTLNGSIGQLFQSKYFKGKFVKSSAAVAAGLDPVYYQPHARNINFDKKLATQPPAGTPTTTKFARGDLFTW